ncbi:hypothetical protein CDO26_35055 (plasmid) [Sinorhizobium meliloti]|nr:hypothetical protein CDO26_35055 [Sinorhizobium meliloti]MQW24183.1 hypothetical protein [Sinorhizobium meliloti]
MRGRLFLGIGGRDHFGIRGRIASEFAQAIERGPTPYLDGVVRWRLCDLGQWLWEEFRVSVSEQTLGRELRSMGYRKLSARPRHHAQEADAAETFKKTSPPQWQKSPRVLPEAG